MKINNITIHSLLIILLLLIIACEKDAVVNQNEPDDQWIPLLVSSTEDPNITDELLMEYATRYRALGCSELSIEQRNKLREYNPDIILTSYFATVSASENIILQYPEWAVKDSFGNYIRSLNSDQLYLLDPGNEDLRNALVAKVDIEINQNGFDGIMYDEATIVRENFYNNFQGINPRTNQIYTIEDFKQEQLATITKIRETFPDIIIVANSIGNGLKYFDNVEIARKFAVQCDYLVAEAFRGHLDQSLDWYQPEDDWLKNIEMNYDLSDYGCALMANVEIELTQVNNDKLKEEFDLFHYASFLLGYRGESVFSNTVQDNSSNIGGGYLNLPVFNEFHKLNPGEPLNNTYEMFGQVYTRRFSKMLVLVNPKSESVVVKSDNSYTDQEGNRYNTGDVITLNANKAILLIK